MVATKSSENLSATAISICSQNIPIDIPFSTLRQLTEGKTSWSFSVDKTDLTILFSLPFPSQVHTVGIVSVEDLQFPLCFTMSIGTYQNELFPVHCDTFLPITTKGTMIKYDVPETIVKADDDNTLNTFKYTRFVKLTFKARPNSNGIKLGKIYLFGKVNNQYPSPEVAHATLLNNAIKHNCKNSKLIFNSLLLNFQQHNISSAQSCQERHGNLAHSTNKKTIDESPTNQEQEITHADKLPILNKEQTIAMQPQYYQNVYTPFSNRKSVEEIHDAYASCILSVLKTEKKPTFLEALEIEFTRLVIGMSQRERDSILFEELGIADPHSFNPYLHMFFHDEKIEYTMIRWNQSKHYEKCTLCSQPFGFWLKHAICGYCKKPICPKCLAKDPMMIPEFISPFKYTVCKSCELEIKKQHELLIKLKILESKQRQDQASKSNKRGEFLATVSQASLNQRFYGDNYFKSSSSCTESSTSSDNFFIEEPRPKRSTFSQLCEQNSFLLSRPCYVSFLENVPHDKLAYPEYLFFRKDVLSNNEWAVTTNEDKITIKIALAATFVIEKLSFVGSKYGYTTDTAPNVKISFGFTPTHHSFETFSFMENNANTNSAKYIDSEKDLEYVAWTTDNQQNFFATQTYSKKQTPTDNCTHKQPCHKKVAEPFTEFTVPLHSSKFCRFITFEFFFPQTNSERTMRTLRLNRIVLVGKVLPKQRIPRPPKNITTTTEGKASSFPYETVSPLWSQGIDNRTILCIPHTLKNKLEGIAIQIIGKPLIGFRIIGQITNGRGEIIQSEKVSSHSFPSYSYLFIYYC